MKNHRTLKGTIVMVMLPALFIICAGKKSGAGVFDIYPDLHSASHSSAPFSSLQNPVFSDVGNSSSFAYRYIIPDGEEEGAHLMTLRFLGFSFTYGWHENIFDSTTGNVINSGAHYFNINKGFFWENIAGFGVGYSFSKSGNSTYDNYGAWSFGFLLRPFSFLSMGITINDVGAKIGGMSLPHRETYSVSFRPFTDRVSISFDTIREKGDGLKDMNFALGGEVRLPLEISLFYKTDNDWNMRFGVALPLYFRGPRSSTLLMDYYRTVNSSSGKELNSLGIAFPLNHYTKGISISREETLLSLRLNRKILEQEQDGFFTRRKITFTEIIEGLCRARTDNNITGVVLHIETGGFGLAQIQEVREELKLFSKAGKKVYAIMYGAGNREYYLAAAADRIYFTPNSTFNLTALSARVYFFKNLLDKAGISFEEIRRGKFKSANESFTRSALSPEARANLKSILTDLNNQFLEDIIADRKITPKIINDLFSEGLIKPEEAVKRGFVDRIMYESEALRDISESLTQVPLSRYIAEKQQQHRWGLKPAIAIVQVTGAIIRGKGGSRGVSEATGDDSYKNDLKAAFLNPAVRAVIIRIDSGGGSAVASDYMLKHLVDFKRKTGKPVIFSFGNVAASGGYYIASSGDPVFSSPGSITGSIGVISGKISLAQLYEKLGISKEVIKLSEFADIFDESRSLTERERTVLQKGVDFIYDRFTGVVMKSRKLNEKEISTRAEGKVFTGTQAKKENLTDWIGGISAAIELARKKTGIGASYRIMMYPTGDTRLREMFETDDVRQMRQVFKTIFSHIDPLSLAGEEYLFRMPYRIEIR